METAALLGAINPDVVLPLGDVQYENGELTDFESASYYAGSWGLFKLKTRPVPGNHEYNSTGAAGYFDYFNGVAKANGLAGPRNKGYYSYDLGSWHIVALNSNISRGNASGQVKWLRADLAANPYACTLAYWHHPRFSSGNIGNDGTMQALWQALYDFDADVILAAHDHDYERFAPQTATGSLDLARGIPSFVVGTGGKSLVPFRTIRANSEVRSDTAFGVLRLTLKPESFDWEFVPIPGNTLSDAGSAACHGVAKALGFNPSDDAQVVGSAPNKNYGRITVMNVDGSPERRALLKFTVQGVGERAIASAKLRLFTTNGSATGGSLHQITGDWAESTVKWNTQPAYDPASFATLGAVSAKQWSEVDVSSQVTGDGVYSFIMISASGDEATYATREAEAWNAPRLVITLQ